MQREHSDVRMALDEPAAIRAWCQVSVRCSRLAVKVDTFTVSVRR
jgi:hypothetical protein